MAYDKDKVYEQAKEAIEKHKLFFIDDIVAFLPIAKSTFYEWKLEQSEQLKAMLEKNRIELKVSMRSKWYKSNAPALQMALMKLICNDDERKMLSMTHNDITTNGKPIIADRFEEMSIEQMQSEIERLKTL